MGVRDDVWCVFGNPLVGPCRGLGQLPFKLEQVFKKMIAPLSGSLCPGYFRTAGDGVRPMPCAERTLPSQPLGFKWSAFRVRSEVARLCCAVGLSEGVSAGNQCDGFLIIHGHALERFTDV